MALEYAQLPDDPEKLKQLLLKHSNLIEALRAEVIRLRRWRFGRSAEVMDPRIAPELPLAGGEIAASVLPAAPESNRLPKLLAVETHAPKRDLRRPARLLPPEGASPEAVSRELGVSAATLERWRAEALASPARDRGWTAAARLDAVLATAALDEASKGAWCREKGIYPEELARWRQAATQALRARGGPRQPGRDQGRPQAHPGARA